MFRRHPFDPPASVLVPSRRRAAARLCVLLSLFAGAALALEDAPVPAPKRQRVETEGAALEFTPVALGKGRRSAKSELKVLLEASATLSLQRDLRQRSLRLPAGQYAIRVEEESAEACWLVIGEPPAADGPKPKSARERRSPPLGIAGRCLEELQRGSAVEDPPAPAPKTNKGEGKEAKKSERTEDGKNPAPRGKGDDEDGDADEVDQADEREKTKGAEERKVAGLRVKLRIQRPEGGFASDELVFSLKSLAKGQRLEISAQAGHTIARGALRFAPATLVK
jgi:hypothetical protein